jgi:ABC-type multidrug transport system fused ATPase/permease subunit
LNTSWRLGLVVLVGVPLILWALALLLRPLHGRQQRLRDRQGELTSRAVDIVSGLRVLRGIGGEDLFARRYREESQRARRAGVAVAGVEALLDGVRILLPGLLVAFVVWLGARRVLAGELSPGQLVAFYGYAVFLAIPLRRLTMTTGLFMKGYVAAQRAVRLLALEPDIASPTPPAPTPGAGAVLADRQSGLVVHPHRLTGVVCASPADAATLADRLGRYVESDATYGGVPLRDLAVDEVRRRVLVAGNDAALFSGSLRTELDPAGRAGPGGRVLAEALDRASARDIVDALPEGLDAPVVGAGREFSGGQRQRLRLVRALMADPDVLLLVEPTSAVDAHTESRIGERIGAGRTGQATVVFTTSPILLDHTDHVSYVEDGTVVAEGTHEELLRTDARYRYVVTRDVE